MPFEALPLNEGYLADKVRVRYAHSISTLLRVPPRQLTSDESSQSPALLLATAPALHEAVRARIERIAPGWSLRSSESAAAELEAVAGNTASERVITLTGADVTESALRDRLPQADLIHIGLPFRINGAGALFSPILLTGDPGDDSEEGQADPRNNASLEAREVMNLQLRAHLAVLSDGAAMSMRDAADDVAVVWWAWRAAGVSTLATARWADETGVSVDLLADFHARLRAGELIGAALRAAQQKIRQTKERAAPFYWAGWLLMGDAF